MERRSFIAGLSALLLPAPPIVHASSLMPIRSSLPDWITAHENNPIWGTLVVKKSGAKLLPGYEGLIKPGEFLWRAPGYSINHGDMIDLHVFPQTWIRVTPNLIEWRRSNGSGARNYVGELNAPLKIGPAYRI